MGLLPLEQPNDPWTQKAFDPHHPLYSGGGSYEAYLRPRRDTHIMSGHNHHMLTPGMLERLLRIKAEFQRRFPHLYQGMLNHHTNQTRVSVKPPLLVRQSNKKIKPKESPVYELGAAERGLFDEPSVEVTSEKTNDSPLELATVNKNKKTKTNEEQDEDEDDFDFFHFEDDDNAEDNDHDNDADLLDD